MGPELEPAAKLFLLGLLGGGGGGLRGTKWVGLKTSIVDLAADAQCLVSDGPTVSVVMPLPPSTAMTCLW